MIKKLIRVLILALPLSIAYQTARADFVMFDGIAANMAMVTMQHSVLENSLKRQNHAAVSTPATEPNVEFSAPPSADLSYKPSAANTKANIAKFIQNSKATNPQAAEQLRVAFANNDILGAMAKAYRTFGLDTRNVADVYAAYFVTIWQAGHQRTDTPSSQTFQAISAQMATSLANTPAFMTMNNAQKQEMAETLIIQTALMDAALEQAAANPEQLEAVSLIALDGSRKLGLDLNAIQITEDGFIPANL
jgi:transcriptional regulator with AAA-type ATPase domain